MTKKPVVLDDVQKEAEFVSIYNSLVDLFNHYLKGGIKHEEEFLDFI